jgi:DNA-binding PadR family transcriptional regulator
MVLFRSGSVIRAILLVREHIKHQKYPYTHTRHHANSKRSFIMRDKKITTENIEQDGGPERKRYAITAQGRKDLEAWLSTPEAANPNTQTVLFIKVVTAILLDKSPDTYLDTQRSAHVKQMRTLTQLRRQGNLAQALQADYALFHLEADLRWIDLTSARLESLTKEIRSER